MIGKRFWNGKVAICWNFSIKYKCERWNKIEFVAWKEKSLFMKRKLHSILFMNFIIMFNCYFVTGITNWNWKFQLRNHKTIELAYSRKKYFNEWNHIIIERDRYQCFANRLFSCGNHSRFIVAAHQFERLHFQYDLLYSDLHYIDQYRKLRIKSPLNSLFWIFNEPEKKSKMLFVFRLIDSKVFFFFLFW